MRFHHVAYVTRDITRKAEQLTALLGFRQTGPAVVDTTQGVRCIFMDIGDGALIELLEPHGENSPVQRHLDKGGGIFHTCYEVDDLDETLRKLGETGRAIVVRDPTPAPAIGHRRIAFVVTEDRDLLEFVEAKRR